MAWRDYFDFLATFKEEGDYGRDYMREGLQNEDREVMYLNARSMKGELHVLFLAWTRL